MLYVICINLCFALQCYRDFNEPSASGAARSYPLCAMQLKVAMDAAKDTPTCIRRSSMITNLNPRMSVSNLPHYWEHFSFRVVIFIKLCNQLQYCNPCKQLHFFFLHCIVVTRRRHPCSSDTNAHTHIQSYMHAHARTCKHICTHTQARMHTTLIGIHTKYTHIYIYDDNILVMSSAASEDFAMWFWKHLQ